MKDFILNIARQNRDQLCWIGFFVLSTWLFWLTVSLFAKGVLP